MIVNDYVLDGRRYTGATPPPDAFEDVSRYGNDGAFVNVTWVREVSGLWVMEFDGAYVDFGAGTGFDAAPTLQVALWFRLNALHEPGGTNKQLWAMRVDGTHQLFCRLEGASGKLQFFNNNGGAGFDISTAETSWAAGVWYHVLSGISNNTGAQLVVDGGTPLTDANTDPSPSGGDFQIGRLPLVGQLFAGTMALIRVHRYALSEAQVWTMFNSERGWFGR